MSGTGSFNHPVITGCYRIVFASYRLTGLYLQSLENKSLIRSEALQSGGNSISQGFCKFLMNSS